MKIQEAEYTSEYWHSEAKKVLDEQLKKQPNTKKAKNVIFFLGDGLSHPTIGRMSGSPQNSFEFHLIFPQPPLEFTWEVKRKSFRLKTSLSLRARKPTALTDKLLIQPAPPLLIFTAKKQRDRLLV